MEVAPTIYGLDHNYNGCQVRFYQVLMWCDLSRFRHVLTIGVIHINCGFRHCANFVVIVLCITKVVPLSVSKDVLSDRHKSTLVWT